MIANPRMSAPRLACAAALAVLCAPQAACSAYARSADEATAARETSFDILLRNGMLLDGSGNAWVRGDVAIRGDRIVAIGKLRDVTAATVVDATGLYVAPGFVDTHSHAGPALETAELSNARPLLAQGITTVFVNPDGGGRTDLEAQRRELLRHGLGVNVALMVPHGSIRQAVMGAADRAPSPEELRRMEEMVEHGMNSGAFVFSSGPFYAPGSFARTDELVALARVAARYGVPYQSHIRDESNYSIGLTAAVDEVITVAREAGTRGVVTHIKALGPGVWGLSATVVQRIEQARAEGIEVFADQYPYDASQTSLMAALVPRWVQAGGGDSTRARLLDPTLRERLLAEIGENLARRGGASRLQIARYAADTSLEGRTLAQIAAARGEDPGHTVVALLSRGGAGVVSFNMREDDIRRFMLQPWTMTASDGSLVRAGEGVPHPRGNGAFARKLRKYVVEDQVVDLAAAIRSMTSLPATVYRMQDRGWLRPGAIADVAVFDLSRIRDNATYEDPHQLAAGMVHVLVNGQFVLRDGAFTSALPGQVLRRE